VALEVGLQGGPTVAATHLSPNRAAAESGLAELLAPGGAADVIAGDLNLDRGGVMLPEPWSVAGDGEGHATFPATSPSAWIDHVLYRSDLWRKTGSWTAEIPATDHLAFFAALEPLPPAPAT
jgi:endonuclease/exonuclease/phosphatase family metal-dependent hydrolase